MYSRSGINDLLTELAADLPRMRVDHAAFEREYAARSQQILAAAAPADQAYVRGVLQAFGDRCRADGHSQDRHAA